MREQYQYWALGHIHKRETLCPDPLIVFPGNLQGRHIRETGPKGCVVVTVDQRENASVVFHPLDVFRWERCIVDAGGAAAPRMSWAGPACNLRCSKLTAIFRWRCGSSCAAPRRPSAACRRAAPLAERDSIAALQIGDGRIWIERVERRTLPPVDLDELLGDEGPLAELSTYLAELKADDAGVDALAAELSRSRKSCRSNWPDRRGR